MNKTNRTKQVVSSLNIIDDTLFQKMAEDIGFCEELLSTVLGQKVIVEKVIPQNSIKNLQGRSVVLDALCAMESGERCNVEVQKSNDDGSDVAELMRIYKNRNIYDYKKFPRTSKRKEQFIRNEKGESEMCEIVENYAREVAAEAAKEAAKNFLENGVDFQVVCKSISNLTEEELKAVYEEVFEKK